MKSFKIIMVALLFTITASVKSQAPASSLTVVIKGIKEVKGKIMLAYADRKDLQKMTYGMVPVLNAGELVYTFTNISAGNGNLYLYQDLNGNMTLDKDESQIPVEPCYNKEKIAINEGDNRITVTLINVKELMGK